MTARNAVTRPSERGCPCVRLALRRSLRSTARNTVTRARERGCPYSWGQNTSYRRWEAFYRTLERRPGSKRGRVEPSA